MLSFIVASAMWKMSVSWLIGNVFKRKGDGAGLFSVICFPYAIRQANKGGPLEQLPLLLFYSAIAIMVVGPYELTPNFVEWFVGLAIGNWEMMILIVILLPSAVAFWLGHGWLASNAFDREGWLPGIAAAIFPPYAIWYGISRFRMNRSPVVASLLGLFGIFSFVAGALFLSASVN